MIPTDSFRVSTNHSHSFRVSSQPGKSSSTSKTGKARGSSKPGELLRILLYIIKWFRVVLCKPSTECTRVFCRIRTVWFRISSNLREWFRVFCNLSFWFRVLSDLSDWCRNSSNPNEWFLAIWQFCEGFRVPSILNVWFRFASNTTEWFKGLCKPSEWFMVSHNPKSGWKSGLSFVIIGLIWTSNSFPAMDAASTFPKDGQNSHPHDLIGSEQTLEENTESLERSIQLAAFQQFNGKSRKTGVIYNFSVPSAPSGTFQAIRVRSGSFRRYGITINEFSIPHGCDLDPAYERVLMVYSHLLNTSLFERTLPEGVTFVSDVLSLYAYDATNNINGSISLREVSITPTGRGVISIQFGGDSAAKCASFDLNPSLNSTLSVNYTKESSQGTCQTDHVGAMFALVNNVSNPLDTTSSIYGLNPAMNASIIPGSIRSNTSNTWKIILGFVFGVSAALVLVIFLALSIRKCVANAELEKMEYRAEKGESLKVAKIKSSRVPAAPDTRTQPRLERDYSV